ncbi:hypothetical protein MADA3029_1070166 [Vibrio nigripulchritudo MADA3029]|uniref:hypothetical protein n=1 Tax=Vibrio TaxID=662 RepID=UPI0003B1FCFC|nr:MULTISPECIES: hypothetical protein [Vibrio]UAB73889.1 hypothetical protein INR79_22370 [Vibrio sp. SCSIO 43132]CCN47488.1 hypothetical protein VIBNIMADA3020_410035 [Vibrio nigripulchritudo MADA3020]CCN55894.1 hypothetical protein VIBNIMADA3021_840166 [Vibrio nigripulchritudo MADA3021]CCN57117.1 hypothetical protein MADA3029_1070166 [Vibrio nigripulchritudo MADA3029]
MSLVDILSVIGSIFSILSFFVAIFIASRVINISNKDSGSVSITGDRNSGVTGRDKNVR